MVAGSVLLFWLSSSATVRLVRSQSGAVKATFERQLFGLVAHSRIELFDIVAVRVVRGEADHSAKRSRTPDRLFFDTKRGPVDLGQVQDMFVREAPEIEEYLADLSRGELSLSSVGRGREKRRFVFAQLIGALLAFGGAGLAMGGIRGLVGRGES